MTAESKRGRRPKGGRQEPETAAVPTALAARLGDQIRRLRLERHWSQRRLAEEAGVVQQNLSMYERGATNPRLETLTRLADALDAEVRIVPRAGGEAAEQPFSMPELLEYIDRQIERTLERGRADREAKIRTG